MPGFWGKPLSRGCLVTKAADQTAANYGSSTAVGWDSEAYDTDAIHDNVTNNSRLTVPAGVSKVRISYSVLCTSVLTGAEMYVSPAKNGASEFVGTPLAMADTSATDHRVSGTSAILSVVPGDYFEVFLQTVGDTSVTVEANYSWFAMEIIE